MRDSNDRVACFRGPRKPWSARRDHAGAAKAWHPAQPVGPTTRFAVVGWALAVVLASGCGPSLPKTYPVKGKVVDPAGKPWAGGAIMFQLAADPRVVADGVIGADGTFTLTTKIYGKAKEGAAEGEHSVMVESGPVVGPDGQAGSRPAVVPRKYKVEPRDNVFTITAHRAGSAGRQ